MAIGALARAVGAPIRRVVFTGGRDVGKLLPKGAKAPYGTKLETSQAKIFEVLDNLGLDPAETTIVHGAARGLDNIVNSWATSRGFKVRAVPANWDKHGKAAGAKRNWQMLLEDTTDLVVAFPGGKGTKNMVESAGKRGVPLLQVNDKLADDISQRGTIAVVEAVAQKYAGRAQAASVAQPRGSIPGEGAAWSRVRQISDDAFEASSKAPKSQSVFRGYNDNSVSKRKMTEDGAPLSALRMRFKDGRTIEEVYQTDVKGYRTVFEGKGKPPLRPMSEDELYAAYKGLWVKWFDENPDQLGLAARVIGNKRINDFWAAPTSARPQGTPNNQARAISDILSDSALRGAPQSPVRGVAPQPVTSPTGAASVAPATSGAVSAAVTKDFTSRVAKLKQILAQETTDPNYAKSQYNQLLSWLKRNQDDLTPLQLDEIRPLAREIMVRSTPEYGILRGFVDELDDLVSSGMRRPEMVREFKDLNFRLLEFIDTMGPAAVGPAFKNVSTSILGRFSAAARDLGAQGSKGGKIGAASSKLKGKADELLEEVTELPTVAPKPVSAGGKKVRDRLDDFVDENFDTETIADARKGIGIGKRTGPDGEVTWDISPEDILQIASRNEEAVRAGAGRMSKTEQQAIDKLNREIFSEEAAVDRFVDRDSPLSRLIESQMGKSSSPDRFLESSQFSREVAADLAAGRYTIRRLRTVVKNPLGAVDEAGNPVDQIIVDRVQKVRVVDQKTGAYQIFDTEVYHNGQKLTGSQLRTAFGACRRCGVIFPTGTPGVCASPTCYSKKILRTVAKKTPEPARFIEQVDNFLGEGPMMSRVRDSIAQAPVERVMVVGDPTARFSQAEVSRFLELLDLPYGAKVLTPARGNVESFVAKWFATRNVTARSEMQKRIRTLKRQGHDTTGMPNNVPDANIERLRVTSEQQLRESGKVILEYDAGTASKASENVLQVFRTMLPSGSSYSKNGTVLLTFGDDATTKAVVEMAKKMRLTGDPVRIVNVGGPETSAVLRELRPDPDVMRYLVNRLDGRAGSVTELLASPEASRLVRAQQEVLRTYPGMVQDKLAGVWRGQAGLVNEYSRMGRLDRLYRSQERIVDALAAPSLPAKTRRSMQTNLARIRKQIDNLETEPLDLRRSFGEGVYIPGEKTIGAQAAPYNRKDLIRRLKSNKDVDLNGRKLTREEKKDLLDFIEEIERWAEIRPTRTELPTARKLQLEFEKYIDGLR